MTADERKAKRAAHMVAVRAAAKREAVVAAAGVNARPRLLQLRLHAEKAAERKRRWTDALEAELEVHIDEQFRVW